MAGLGVQMRVRRRLALLLAALWRALGLGGGGGGAAAVAGGGGSARFWPAAAVRGLLVHEALGGWRVRPYLALVVAAPAPAAAGPVAPLSPTGRAPRRQPSPAAPAGGGEALEVVPLFEVCSLSKSASVCCLLLIPVQ